MAEIDFHCHIDLYPDPHGVAAEVARRGVYVLSVTTTPSAFEKTRELAPPKCRIQTALGLHPEIAAKREHELDLFAKLLPSTDYVGEVGLDGSAAHRDTLDKQGAILTHILGLCAKNGGKTISLHSRGATSLLLDLLEFEPLAGRPVLHWFSGSMRAVSRASELGCWFSVGAPMLSSESGRRAVRCMPINKILPETDGPFVQRGGRFLYPWDASAVSIMLGELLGIPTEEIRSQFAKKSADTSKRNR